MQIATLLVTIIGCGAITAAAFSLAGWKSRAVPVGGLTGIFLSSLYAPWLYMKVPSAAPVVSVTAAIVCISLIIWFIAYASRQPLEGASKHRTGHSHIIYDLKILIFFGLNVLLFLFILNTYRLVPTTAWDTLWYWGPLAIDLLAGGELPSSGHPSFGAYGLAYASQAGIDAGFPGNGLLLAVQATSAVCAVLLLTRNRNLPLIILLTLYLCMSSPMFYQTYFSIGYFDVHVAVCILISLVILIDIQEKKTWREKLFGLGAIAMLLWSALILKTTSLIPVTCFLAVALTVFLKSRALLAIGFTATIICAFYVSQGFYFSVMGREFSIDWERNPTMIVPGLWQDIFHDASIGAIFHNFYTAFLVNQSYSVVAIAALILIFFKESKKFLKTDLRVRLVGSLILVEFLLQMVVPYFFENAVADSRLTRSILIVPLIIMSFLADEILRIGAVPKDRLRSALAENDKAT